VEDILLGMAFKIVHKPTPAILADMTGFLSVLLQEHSLCLEDILQAVNLDRTHCWLFL
jgi:hypothetical protein